MPKKNITTEGQQKATIEDLPREVFEWHISPYLDAQDLASTVRASKRLNSIFKPLGKQQFQNCLVERLLNHSDIWKRAIVINEERTAQNLVKVLWNESDKISKQSAPNQRASCIYHALLHCGYFPQANKGKNESNSYYQIYLDKWKVYIALMWYKSQFKLAEGISFVEPFLAGTFLESMLESSFLFLIYGNEKPSSPLDPVEVNLTALSYVFKQEAKISETQEDYDRIQKGLVSYSRQLTNIARSTGADREHLARLANDSRRWGNQLYRLDNNQIQGNEHPSGCSIC